MSTNPSDPDFITIKTACAIIGGDRPISLPTYYRGVKNARWPAPEHPSPGISRIRKPKLLEALNRAANGGGDKVK